MFKLCWHPRQRGTPRDECSNSGLVDQGREECVWLGSDLLHNSLNRNKKSSGQGVWGIGDASMTTVP
jgi:hypothetical protein